MTWQPVPQSFVAREGEGRDKWESWTPTRTSWTDTGTPTVEARFRVIGSKVEFQIRVTPATDVATTAGTSYVSLPIAASGIAGLAAMYNQTTSIAVGLCAFDITNSRVYVPTQAASGNVFAIAGWYEV